MPDHGKTMIIDATQPDERSLRILKALASEWRLKILQMIGAETWTVNQIAQSLGIPLSTAGMHIKELEDAELIHVEMQPASRGVQKACSRRHDQVMVILPPIERSEEKFVETAMPIGAYNRFEVVPMNPTCGLATEDALIGIMDDPVSFFEPQRVNAQLIWFRAGFLEYQFPYRVPPKVTPTALQVRMEICSEAPTHNDNWPSDITLWINNCEVGTWTSPGDFGGTRGALTPSWWLDADTQFGLLKRWQVTGAGTYLDGMHVSDVKLSDLKLGQVPWVTVRIGVKPDATHVGGINLFGKKFGNYPEDLVLRIIYE